MKETELKLASDLTVPVGIAAKTVFIAGTKGSGKTYTAGVLVEELLSADVHVVVLDPLGVWWGLRSPADDAAGGDANGGGFPIVILGGDHGDQPLLPTAGEVVADFVVRSGQSCVLDLSKFDSDAEQDRFVTALLKKLFRLKSGDRTNLHLVMDEADLFAPQQPQPGQMAMLGAAKAIVTKARSRGLSMTMISQRPQSVSKACSDEADLVICHRIQGLRAAKAMKEWIEQHAGAADVKSFVETLPTLKNGEAWFWSPSMNIFGRHQVRRKTTFDSSRTPAPGEVARKPKASAAVDLQKLTAEMAAIAEQAKADDPAAMRKRIAELERSAKVPTRADPPVFIDKLVVPDGQLKELGELLERAEQLAREAIAASVGWKETSNAAAIIADHIRQAIATGSHPVFHWDAGAGPRPKLSAATKKLLPDWPDGKIDYGQTFTVEPSPAKPSPAGVKLSAAQRRLLDAAAWWRSIGVHTPTRPQVAFVARIKPTGGHFSNSIGPLITHGLLDNADAGTVRLTADGVATANTPLQRPTLSSYHDGIREILATGAQKTLFDAIVGRGGADVGVEQLGKVTGINPAGGHFSNSIGPLGTLGLITRGKGVVKPTVLLFPEGLK